MGNRVFGVLGGCGGFFYGKKSFVKGYVFLIWLNSYDFVEGGWRRGFCVFFIFVEKERGVSGRGVVRGGSEIFSWSFEFVVCVLLFLSRLFFLFGSFRLLFGEFEV